MSQDWIRDDGVIADRGNGPACAACGYPNWISGRYDNCQGAGGSLHPDKPCLTNKTSHSVSENSGVFLSPGNGGPAGTTASGIVLKKSESQRRKETPVYSGVLMYFPDAINAVARASYKGDTKHNGPNDGSRKIRWARRKSMDQEDCVVRHMMTPDEIDPETGETHLTHAAWRVLAALQLQQEKLKEKK